MTRLMIRLVFACLLVGLVAAPAASAASTIQILRDCEDDGKLQGSYTPAELRKARNNIPTDTDEYTNCRDVLARAATSGVAGRGGSTDGSGTGGAGDPDVVVGAETAEDRAAIARAAAKGAPDPVTVDGRPVVPGAAGFAANAARNDLPITVLILLVLIALAVVAAAVPVARRRMAAVVPALSRRVLASVRR